MIYAKKVAHLLRALTQDLISPNKLAEVIEQVARCPDEHTPDDFTKREQKQAELLGYTDRELDELVNERDATLKDVHANIERRNVELSARSQISERQLEYEQEVNKSLRRLVDILLTVPPIPAGVRGPKYRLGQSVKKRNFLVNETSVIGILLTDSGFDYIVRDGNITGFEPAERIEEERLEPCERRD